MKRPVEPNSDCWTGWDGGRVTSSSPQVVPACLAAFLIGSARYAYERFGSEPSGPRANSAGRGGKAAWANARTARGGGDCGATQAEHPVAGWKSFRAHTRPLWEPAGRSDRPRPQQGPSSGLRSVEAVIVDAGPLVAYRGASAYPGPPTTPAHHRRRVERGLPGVPTRPADSEPAHRTVGRQPAIVGCQAGRNSIHPTKAAFPGILVAWPAAYRYSHT